MSGEGAGQSGLRRISAEEFVRRLQGNVGQDDTHYAFWLGAGCSVSSGIPGAAPLVTDHWLPRLREIRGAAEIDLDEWAEGEFPGYDPENPAAIYGPVMEALFLQPEARQREVEKLCDGRFPGFGYAVLAALLAHDDGLFNVALTTNFDDLIADAMYVFAEARPLVIPDDSLASFIRPTRMRPLVVKVHGDHRLSPRNTATETSELKQGISESICNLLHDCSVIFLGYGGNDVGIADLGNSLPAQALPLGIWWASRTEPEGVLRGWLERRDAIWVEIPSFDELMLLFKSEFEIPNPSSTKFDQVFSNYLNTYTELEKHVVQIPDSHPQASSLKGAAARADASATDWTAAYLRAALVEEEDPEQAETLYKQGIVDFPRAVRLYLGLSALLLFQTRIEEAIEWSEKAMEVEGDNESVLRWRAQVLGAAGRLPEALDLLKRVVGEKPLDLESRAAFGIYSARNGEIRKAREQLKWLLDSRPTTTNENSLIGLLADECGDPLQGVEFHVRAIAEEPENASSHAHYARCLITLDRPEEALREVQLGFDCVTNEAVMIHFELHFYALALQPEQQGDDSIPEMKRMIAEGVRIPTWDLTQVVKFLGESMNPDARWLKLLARVISGKDAPEVLQQWKRWRDAS